MGKIPSRGSDQFVLRFPPGMRDQIRDIAEKSGRSMNAEIIARLADSLEMDSTMDNAAKNPDAAFASIKPMMEMISEEVARRYEERLSSMAEAIDGISDMIKGGKLAEDAAARVDATIDRLRKRDDDRSEEE